MSILPVARTKQTTPTDHWQYLVRVHNQHIQANINAGGGIYTGIEERSGDRTWTEPTRFWRSCVAGAQKTIKADNFQSTGEDLHTAKTPGEMKAKLKESAGTQISKLNWFGPAVNTQLPNVSSPQYSDISPASGSRTPTPFQRKRRIAHRAHMRQVYRTLNEAKRNDERPETAS
uniref:Uncharacterized protein n=1 Tax=Globodera pallida TaxID=36090 RepID=A0A183CFU2_GLOPA